MAVIKLNTMSLYGVYSANYIEAHLANGNPMTYCRAGNRLIAIVGYSMQNSDLLAIEDKTNASFKTVMQYQLRGQVPPTYEGAITNYRYTPISKPEIAHCNFEVYMDYLIF